MFIACLPSLCIPYTDGRVHASADNPQPVECDGVDLVMMAPEDVETFPSVNVPKAACEIIASTRDLVPADIDCAYTILMTLENTETLATLNIPYPECAISRTCDSYGSVVQHLQASDR